MITVPFYLLLSLHTPTCPTLLRAVALGRKWAYEDFVKDKKEETLKALDLDEIRFQRLWLRELLLLRRRLSAMD